MPQARRIKHIIKNELFLKQKILFEIFLILFFETCIFVNKNFYGFQMHVFLTFLNTNIW